VLRGAGPSLKRRKTRTCANMFAGKEKGGLEVGEKWEVKGLDG